MTKKLLLLGAGHAHLTVMARIREIVAQGYAVTVVGSSPHYYSGMGPGMLGGVYTPEEISFRVREMVENKGGEFIEDRAVFIDADRRRVRLASGTVLDYHVLSCNTGSTVSRDLIRDEGKDIFPVKPIENLLHARKRILELLPGRPVTVAVAGGGPGAVEVAGNVWRAAYDALKNSGRGSMPCIRVLAGKRLLGKLPERVRSLVRRSFAARGMQIIERGYVSEIRSGRLQLDSGEEYRADIILHSPGITPSPLFRDSGLPLGPDRGLLVDKYLRSTAYPDIFGGGDCIHFVDQPLDKVGVYAVRQNPVLFNNLVAALNNEPLEPFKPGGGYLLVYNLGDGTGVFRKGPVVLGGRLAFRIKDYIDRTFMRRFQGMEK